jgi:hypothetical protein
VVVGNFWLVLDGYDEHYNWFDEEGHETEAEVSDIGKALLLREASCNFTKQHSIA